MKNLLRVMIFIVILIIVFLIIYMVINNNETNYLQNEQPDETQEAEEYYNEMKKNENIIMDVNNAKEFYEVEYGIQMYLDYIYEKNSNGVYSLLLKKYINENNLTINNVLEQIEGLSRRVTFTAVKMHKISKGNIVEYSVEGNISNTDEQKLGEKIFFILDRDNNNGTYGIYPLDNQYSNIEDININVDIEEIEENEFNLIEAMLMHEDDIIRKYLTYYKRMTVTDIDESYNMLDEEYRDKRFGNKDEYLEYIRNNQDYIMSILVSKYKISYDGDIKVYTIIDQNSNFYTFEEKSVMDYKVFLDTYTIDSDNFIEEYNSSDERNKIMLNIDRWVQMINARDYRTSYNVLDKTFRENNFGTEADFENYMRQNFPSHYSVEYGEYSEQGQLGIQTIYLTDILNENNRIEKTIIMQLQEGTDFIMSFNVE